MVLSSLKGVVARTVVFAFPVSWKGKLEPNLDLGSTASRAVNADSLKKLRARSDRTVPSKNSDRPRTRVHGPSSRTLDPRGGRGTLCPGGGKGVGVDSLSAIQR